VLCVSFFFNLETVFNHFSVGELTFGRVSQHRKISPTVRFGHSEKNDGFSVFSLTFFCFKVDYIHDDDNDVDVDDGDDEIRHSKVERCVAVKGHASYHHSPNREIPITSHQTLDDIHRASYDHSQGSSALATNA